MINALSAELARYGVEVVNDRHRDLFAKLGGGILFEAKTDLDLGSIYTAIGQLMAHATECEPLPRKVFVAPGEPNARARRWLDNLGIVLISYRLDGDRVVFDGLDRLLAACRHPIAG